MSTHGVAGRSIDINVDAGESFGRWRVADEAGVFPYVSSVNLACGFHAGDPANLLRSIAMALEHGLSLGAHPGYPDKVGFGRRDMQLADHELFADTVYQLGALDGLVRAATRGSVRDPAGDGQARAAHAAQLGHVKAHGALYQRTMSDRAAAAAFARAVTLYDAGLAVLVLAGPGGAIMRETAADAGLRTVDEAFPDRAYLRSGSLAPRAMNGAVLTDPGLIAERAVAMAIGRPFKALDGGEAVVTAETLCLHGDGASAPEAARAVHRALTSAGVAVRSFRGHVGT